MPQGNRQRLRPVSAEHLLEVPHQCRPLLELGRVVIRSCAVRLGHNQTIPVGSPLGIRLVDRLEYERPRPAPLWRGLPKLKGRGLCPILRYLPSPGLEWLVGVLSQPVARAEHPRHCAAITYAAPRVPIVQP
jgi:hypothetical protein